MSKAKPARKTGPKRRSPAAEITTFPTACRYLLERVNFERSRLVRNTRLPYKLERMQKLMIALDRPHEEVRMIHVGGTVGKGSTVSMLASMLQGCGYATGQYTSPHITDQRERIAINGKLIGKADMTRLTRTVAKAAAKINLDPTYFEAMTALAFLYFAEEAVDIAVIEVGLGGRLDCTNVIRPEVSVITRIDRDHTQLLGDTLESIAREKAGIIKPGIPVITCEQFREVDQVLKSAAERQGSRLRIVNKDIEFSYRFGASGGMGPHSRLCLITETSQFMHLPVPLPGEHQAINCALALSAIDTLKASGFSFPEASLLEGLASTKLPGRMELVSNKPLILVDGAHNAAAIGALMRSVGAHVPYDSMVCIFGCCEDKDIGAMLEKLALGGDKVIFTRARANPRSADPVDLQRAFTERSGKMSQTAKSLPEALDLAYRAVGRDDLICVTGSFYLVGDVKNHLATLQRSADRAAEAAAVG